MKTTTTNGKRGDKDITEAAAAMDRDPLDSWGLDPLADAIARVARENAAWARAQAGRKTQ